MADLDEVAATGLVAVSDSAGRVAEAAVQGVLLAAHRHPTVGFPFGNPISFEWRHLPLIGVPYLVAAKTNGVRVAVCMGAAPGDGSAAPAAPAAFLMDRNRVLYGLPLQGAPAWVFQGGGTLLDAELAVGASGDPDAGYIITVFDAALVGGIPVHTAALTTRLEMAASAVQELSSPLVRFVVKRMVPLTATLTAEEVLGPGPRAPSDGFILTPQYAAVSSSGTAEAIFKLKDPHTLDVLWGDTGLWYGDGADFVGLSALRPKVDISGLPSQAAPAEPVVVELAIVEITEELLQLQFVALRPGKRQPNNVRCVERTLVSAREKVGLLDIVQALQRPAFP